MQSNLQRNLSKTGLLDCWISCTEVIKTQVPSSDNHKYKAARGMRIVIEQIAEDRARGEFTRRRFK